LLLASLVILEIGYLDFRVLILLGKELTIAYIKVLL